jgi:hypothetical protein
MFPLIRGWTDVQRSPEALAVLLWLLSLRPLLDDLLQRAA